MPLKIIRQDITKIKCDAIVNPTNRFLNPDGGTDLAIHRAAGERLLEECRRIGKCAVGDAVITPAFDLPCKYVIHTAGPNWYEEKDPEGLLVSCYTRCLELALDSGCESMAFPLISSGLYGYPKDKVLSVATRVIGDFLFENELQVYLVVYDKDSYEVSRRVFSDVQAFISDNYVDALSQRFTRFFAPSAPLKERRADKGICRNKEILCDCSAAPSLDDMIESMDKGFAETLFYYIDKKGVSDVECYKMSNVDKKTFSKIKCNKDYKPSKITAVSFAIGLRLDIDETEHLLNTVGMSLSKSSLFDVIIEYFIRSGEYETVFDVNEVLYKYDQVLLGV